MKITKFRIFAILSVFATVLAGCITYQDSPTTAWNGSSQAGVPVKTRLTGTDTGFRFLFIGSSPSEQAAIDNLYNAASAGGYKIDGSSYAFQNMYVEQSGFLYPFIGYGYLTVWGDVYKYDYKGTEYSVKELNSSVKHESTVFSLFQNLF